MTMVTRLIRVVQYKTKNSLNPSMKLSFDFTQQVKYIIHLQETHGHQTKQGADLFWDAPTLKVTWHYDHVTNVRLRLKNLYFYFHKTYGL